MGEIISYRTGKKIGQSILKVLAYFDLFDYPVLREEILFFLDQRNIDAELLEKKLNELVSTQAIYRQGVFYSLRDDWQLSERRIAGNIRAEALLPIGKRICHFLYQFPFVRGIGISGSLSKKFALKDDDIDYFIITKTNRLWIARTLMHLLKKLSFLVSCQHLYCMNYFVDEQSMEIEEKNIFTAMELITLIPVCGNGTMDKFFGVNSWVKSYHPSFQSKMDGTKTFANNSAIKKAIEFLLDNRFGDWVDNFCMGMTSKRWQKKEKEKKLNAKGRRMGLRTGKHFAKPNPGFFQNRIISNYLEKLNENSAKWVE